MTARRFHLCASLTAGLLVTAPSVALASEDCLDGWVAMEPAFTDTIPADGVIALRADGYGPDESVDIAVYPNFGEPIAGALERSAGMLVWRPAQPLTPGLGYTLHLRAYNRAADEYCGFPEEIELLETFTASEPGRPEPRWELIDVRHWVEVHPSGASEDIVCCDGAYPWYDDYQGGYALGDQCAATRGEGRLHTAYAIAPEAWRLGQGQLGYRPFYDLEVEHAYVSAFDPDVPLPCAELSATDLVTGYVLRGPPVCPDPALAEQLGEYVLDPRDTLTCDTLQTCEEAEDSILGWDPDDCRRWRGEGCGCAANGRGDAATLGLVVLLAALRRGRRRSRSATDSAGSRG